MHLHYDAGGTGAARTADPVVLLHGGGPGAFGLSNFGRNLPVFAERFRTLVVDQPGFGKSDKPPVEGNYFTLRRRRAGRPPRRARHQPRPPGRQLPRRGDRGPVRPAATPSARAAWS